jgi:hypothetical protein
MGRWPQDRAGRQPKRERDAGDDQRIAAARFRKSGKGGNSVAKLLSEKRDKINRCRIIFLYIGKNRQLCT